MRATATGILLILSLSPGAQARSVRIGVIADLNGTECQTLYPANSLRAFGELLRVKELDQILLAGDAVHGECLSYNGSVPYSRVVEGMWSEFSRRFHRPAVEERGIPFAMAPGNHDAPFLVPASREGFRTENQGFVRYWEGWKNRLGVRPLELKGAASAYPYYWAYIHENILFVILQSTKTGALANSGPQKAWLRALLSSPEARQARARIAIGHVPPYPVLDPKVGAKYLEIMKKEQVGEPGSLSDLLLDQGVELLIAGHSHAPFPAELERRSDGKRLRVLSMPCAHAPRILRGKGGVAPRGFAVLELSDSLELKVSIRNWSDGTPVPESYFPEQIPLDDPRVSYRRWPAYGATAESNR